MNKGKTQFQLVVNAEPQVINQIIQSYLQANNFKPKMKENANYYEYYDPFIYGKRGFEYYINGNQVTILAYLGTYEKPKLLDDGKVGIEGKRAYKSSMEVLFSELMKLNAPANSAPVNQQQGYQQPNYQQPVNQQQGYQQPNYQQPVNQQQAFQQNQMNQQVGNSYERFSEEKNKKKENLALIGFFLAIIELFFTFINATFGIAILIAVIYFGIQGLKTKRKYLSMATLALSLISIFIIVYKCMQIWNS